MVDQNMYFTWIFIISSVHPKADNSPSKQLPVPQFSYEDKAIAVILSTKKSGINVQKEE